MGKRIFLFILTNIAVVLTLTIVLSVLGVDRYVGPAGLNIGSLAVVLLRLGHGRRVHLTADVAVDREARHRHALVDGHTGDPAPIASTG
jgi:heat shock protein HtpX